MEEGHGTALLVESELAGHRSAKSHSLSMLVERCVDPSIACKTEHGCFPGHLLKANIWLVGLWQRPPGQIELLAGAGCEGMEKQLRAWHSLQASEIHTGLCLLR